MMSAVSYITRDGDCLDLICFRHYGRSAGMVERVLEANYGLADLGPIYPENIKIVLPDVPKPKVQREINIWE